ncbi:MAG TPA: mandelate racemase/muconate lactonizing enzyme family protein, partial [Anaerolineae bacterium]
ADCAIVLVYTDAGLTGIAEACAYGHPLLIRDWVHWLSHDLLGLSPAAAAARLHPNGRNRSYDCAVAGIDCALWDLRGKIAGKRVSQLLKPTGNTQDSVPLYASGGCRYDWRKRPEQLIDEALEVSAAGFTAMKFRIGTEWSWDGVTLDRFLNLVRDLAHSVDGRMKLMLDGNCRLTEEQAFSIARELDRLGFAWFEEPIARDNIAGYTRLAAAVEMPISGGEGFTTAEQFRPYLENHAYDIVQPDVGMCGLTEGMNIAHIADRYGVQVCPHNWHNGLMVMANAHYVAALPQPGILELCMIQGPLQWEILRELPDIHAGALHFSDRPGLGVEIDDDVASRFPYIEGNYAIAVER